MTEPAPYRTRLSVLFAAAAPKAVILRRGPKTHWRLIDWDLKTGTFTPGQWMKGLVRLCDLSPSGDKLIYWAAQYHGTGVWLRKVQTAPFDPTREALTAKSLARLRRRHKVARYLRPLLAGGTGKGHPRKNEGTWTAISTPPYFSALAIWPAIGHWTGGGIFHTERMIFLNESEGNGMTPIENVAIPSSVQIHSAFGASSAGLVVKRAALGPWYGQDLEQLGPAKALIAAGFDPLDFVYAHPSGDLLFGAGGCIYRIEDWQETPPENYAAAARLLADFRDMRFEQVPTPAAAMRW